MRQVAVYALYAWLAISMIGLAVALGRRLLRPRRGGPTEAGVTEPGVTELLAGIRLPPSLVTATGAGTTTVTRLDLTSDEPAAEVAPLLADELERLGYHLTPSGPLALRAERGSDNLMVEIKDPDAGTRLTISVTPD